jgi:hypothetical protein
MNTTNTTDIYAPNNEAAWEREVRAALNRVVPGMGDQLRRFTNGSGELAFVGPIPNTRTGEVTAVRQRNGVTAIIYGIGAIFAIGGNREPIGAICLALGEYRRQVEGVTT